MQSCTQKDKTHLPANVSSFFIPDSVLRGLLLRLGFTEKALSLCSLVPSDLGAAHPARTISGISPRPGDVVIKRRYRT